MARTRPKNRKNMGKNKPVVSNQQPVSIPSENPVEETVIVSPTPIQEETDMSAITYREIIPSPEVIEETPETEQALIIEEVPEQRAVSTSIAWPVWPVSKPGPRATPPPPGMRPINGMRPEQLAEVGYNQETGQPATDDPLRYLPDERLVGQTGFDQPRTAQDVLGKRKKRL